MKCQVFFITDWAVVQMWYYTRMKTEAKKTPRFSKKQKILTAIIGVLVILVGWWGYVQIMPHPLGERLEYLGRQNFGGWFIERSSEYYYGTNMTQEELKTSFKKAHYDSSVQDIVGHSATYSSKDMLFNSNKGGFVITYYNDANAVIESLHLPNSNKKHVISIIDSSYDIAKDALQ